MNTQLPESPRILLEVELRPIQGTRFQPTGFPDLGAGTYELFDGTAMLVVESTQSVANRLEATSWDLAASRIAEPLTGLSYVSVVNEAGVELTNSLLEAHRLNSVYIEKTEWFATLKQELAPAASTNGRGQLARILAKYDFNSLLHGVFLESIAGTLRVPRAVSGFIEARDVRSVATGGVKNDRVNPGTVQGSDATAREGFGNVPYHREEFTANRISAFFNIDLMQIRSYGLGTTAESLLYLVALWKIRTFLEEGLRLRTACDLEPSTIQVTRPHGLALPSRAELAGEVKQLIRQASQEGLFAAPPVTTVVFANSKTPSASKSRNKRNESESEAE